MDVAVNTFPFNNSVETALRTLSILDALFPQSFDLECLVCLDYICVHSADFFEGITSLHPDNPNRSGEISVRRSIIEDALMFLHIKNLICISYLPTGIEYQASDLSTSFLDRMSTPYSRALIQRSTWMADQLGDWEKQTIQKVVKEKTSSYAFQILR